MAPSSTPCLHLIQRSTTIVYRQSRQDCTAFFGPQASFLLPCWAHRPTHRTIHQERFQENTGSCPDRFGRFNSPYAACLDAIWCESVHSPHHPVNAQRSPRQTARSFGRILWSGPSNQAEQSCLSLQRMVWVHIHYQY